MGPAIRIPHSNGEPQRFLMTLPPGVAGGGGSPLHTGELEKAGSAPHLAQPLKMKQMPPGQHAD